MSTSTASLPTQILSSCEAVKDFTYYDLKNFHIDALKARLLSEGKAFSSLNNHTTALNQWLEHAVWLNQRLAAADMHRSASLSDCVGAEFNAEFELRLKEHILELKREGMAPSTIHSRKHLLREWRKSWLQLLKTLTLPLAFSEALQALKGMRNVNYRQLARACKVDASTIRKWAEGIYVPLRRSVENVAMLEEYFGVQPGSLISRLPNVLTGDGDRSRRHKNTPYRAYLSDISKKPYKLPYESFTEEQQREWDDLYKFYTNSAWAAGRGLNRHKIGWRTRKNNRRNSTAEIRLRYLQDFYGFLILPGEPDDTRLKEVKFVPEDKSHDGVRGLDPQLKGLGLDPTTLSLALVAEFTDLNLVAEWIELLKRRSFGNRNNYRVRNALNFFAQLVRPEYGFLWQQHEYGRKLPEPILTQEEWRARCSEAHRRIRNILTYIKNSRDEEDRIVQTRDTTLRVVIPLIKSREHPLTVMTDIIEGLRSDIERTIIPVTKAVRFRNMIMVELLASNPVRAINIAEMRYKVGSHGYEYEETNLYKVADGSYRLKYEIDELKNGATMGRYDLPVNQEWTRDLDEYFTVWRPLLMDADRCDYVYRPRPSMNILHRQEIETGQVAPMNEADLTRIMREVSQDYVTGCAGFGLHSARHFTATEWLKHYPGAYAIVSVMLHDLPLTVEEAYSWVTPDDKVSFWNRHLTTIIQQSRRRKG